jgi:hypothetical protein
MRYVLNNKGNGISIDKNSMIQHQPIKIVDYSKRWHETSSGEIELAPISNTMQTGTPVRRSSGEIELTKSAGSWTY